MSIDHQDTMLQILIQQHLLSEEIAIHLKQAAAESKVPLLRVLLEKKLITDVAIAKLLANHFALDFIELHQRPNDLPSSIDIPLKLLTTYAALPIAMHSDYLIVAISDPKDFALANEFSFQSSQKVKVAFSPYYQLTRWINVVINNRIYHSTTCSVVQLAQQLLTDAIYRAASDIHIESLAQQCRIRFRIDGLLHEILKFPAASMPALISHLKILANMDIAEKRLPQDGRFTFTTISGIIRDCRTSSCPTQFGEKFVIRLLDLNQNLLNLDELGFDTIQKACLLKKIVQPQGLILITGPTGSGKTITLYSILNHINNIQKNISTIEDPIELHLEGINQVNIHPKAGLDFSAALRAFLRQDPDIIMVGEIRDLKTAALAIRAAHTGHLVFSTLHTNSAALAITRLINMGIEPYNIASTTILIIAQRLIRRLCEVCKQPIINNTNNQLEYTNSTSPCSFCFKGYHGRKGIFELLPITKTIQDLILKNCSGDAIASAAKNKGMHDLWQSGLNQVTLGITSMSEIYRVLPSTSILENEHDLHSA